MYFLFSQTAKILKKEKYNFYNEKIHRFILVCSYRVVLQTAKTSRRLYDQRNGAGRYKRMGLPERA